MVQLLNERKSFDFTYEVGTVKIQGSFTYNSERRIKDLWGSITENGEPSGSFNYNENPDGTTNQSVNSIPDEKVVSMTDYIGGIISDIKTQLNK